MRVSREGLVFPTVGSTVYPPHIHTHIVLSQLLSFPSEVKLTLDASKLLLGLPYLEVSRNSSQIQSDI